MRNFGRKQATILKLCCFENGLLVVHLEINALLGVPNANDYILDPLVDFLGGFAW